MVATFEEFLTEKIGDFRKNKLNWNLSITKEIVGYLFDIIMDETNTFIDDKGNLNMYAIEKTYGTNYIIDLLNFLLKHDKYKNWFKYKGKNKYQFNKNILINTNIQNIMVQNIADFNLI